jgi:transcriptional enhancer factor
VILGRYPGRNQFISQYILNKTGERRTSLQVGSRLQQLRESCSGQECTWITNIATFCCFDPSILQVRDLLFPSPYSVLDTSSNLYGSPVTDHRRVAEPGPPHLFIFIDIVPEGSSAQPYESSPQPWLESENVIHVSRFPRRLSCISPTITFTAPAPILAQSRFAVCTNDGTVHTESVLLTVSRHPNLGGLLYSAGLVPSYWKTIVESPGGYF